MRILTCFLFALSLLAADAQHVTIGTGLPVSASSALATIDPCLIDAATDACYWVFQAPENSTTTTFLFNYVSSSGTPVAHRISFQGVNLANGRNNGTVAAAAAWTPTGGAGIVALSISHDGSGSSIFNYAMTRGALYALVIEPCPGATAPCGGAATPDGSNNSTFGLGSTYGQGGANQQFPYAVLNNAGSNSKQSRAPIFGYRSASKTYGNPVSSIGATTINSGDDQAIRFTIPAGWCASYKIAGARFIATSAASGQAFNLNLYSGTTVLQQVSWDADVQRAAGSAGGLYAIWFDDTPSTLTCGTEYRLGVTPLDAATAIGVTVATLAASGDRTAYAGGSIFGWSTRTGCAADCDTTSTAWADDDTKRPLVELILEDITAPAGGGAAFTFIGGGI